MGEVVALVRDLQVYFRNLEPLFASVVASFFFSRQLPLLLGEVLLALSKELRRFDHQAVAAYHEMRKSLVHPDHRTLMGCGFLTLQFAAKHREPLIARFRFSSTS
jgi:hypothetical protein